MYSLLPSFVLGFHGCDREVGEAVVEGSMALKPSDNEHDWLGPGTYFWENSPDRALSYVSMLKERRARAVKPIRTPFVVGAVIDLGYCLNLTDEKALKEVEAAHEALKSSLEAVNQSLPNNQPGFFGDADLLKRNLDCAVFRALHSLRKEQGLSNYKSIRSPFLEGGSLYPGAGFRKETHIQICVRDPSCIKGYFRPLTLNGSLFLP